MPRRRAYDNSRRAAQADRTAERILDATIARLGSPPAALSLPAIAAGAGVAVPTVYKYFPNRQAIFEAVQERINQRLGRPRWPASPEELRAAVPQLHRFFADHESLVRAVVTAPALRPFWQVTRRARDAALARALRELTAHLSAERRAAAAAMIARVVGVEAWLALKDDWRLPDAAITAATLDSLDMLLAGLARTRRRARKETHRER